LPILKSLKLNCIRYLDKNQVLNYFSAGISTTLYNTGLSLPGF
jgi:hypothetical protein